VFTNNHNIENNSEYKSHYVDKTTINHPPVITIFIGGINLPFPVMGGLKFKALFYPH
jgi:hypothetical protein